MNRKKAEMRVSMGVLESHLSPKFSAFTHAANSQIFGPFSYYYYFFFFFAELYIFVFF